MKTDVFNNLLVFIFIILLNFPFFYFAREFSLVRPFVNIDYLFVLVFFVFELRLVGALFLIFAIFSDFLSLVSQVFPFFRLEEVFYLAKFVFLAPFFYKVIIYFFIAFLIFMVSFHFVFAWRVSKFGLFIALLAFGGCFVVSSIFSDGKVTYRKPPGYFSSSQIEYLFLGRSGVFSERVRRGGAFFFNYAGKRAVDFWVEKDLDALPSQLMLVVSESWGLPIDKAVHEDLLSPLFDVASHRLEYGEFRFSGATVEGELRELCGLESSGYDLREIPKELTGKCFPSLVRENGYDTSSFHGASSTMYDRYLWYPSVGFDQSVFFESRKWPRRCYSFPGACDIDAFNMARDFFSLSEKGFYYWLTLNSHSPYDDRDIHYYDFDCAGFLISAGEVCNNLMLHAQYFYAFSTMMKSVDMQGVEVVIVGDHEPRFADRKNLENNFEVGVVPWVRLIPRSN